MRTLSLACGLSAALFACVLSAQEAPKPSTPTKEHEWLRQFVGEWETEGESPEMPGQPAMKCKGTVKARMLGTLWLVLEPQNEVMGMQMNALQTIGYDPEKKKYHGTWVDSMINHLWRYDGTVDATGKILTLEADGPDFTQPGKTAKYRDLYEFKSADQIVTTSQALGPDGKWMTFMKGNMRRKAAK